MVKAKLASERASERAREREREREREILNESEIVIDWMIEDIKWDFPDLIKMNKISK